MEGNMEGSTGEYAQSIQQSMETVGNTMAVGTQVAEFAEDVLELLLSEIDNKLMQPVDDVSIRVGTKTVYKGPLDGSGDRRLNEAQAQSLADLANNPTQLQGSVRIFGDDPNTPIYHNTAGRIKRDELGLFEAQSQTQAISTEAQTAAIDPVEQASQALVPSGDVQQLMAEIQGLKDRVASLEKKLAESPQVGVKDRVGNWVNGLRDRAASLVHDFADKLAVSTQQKMAELKSQVEERAKSDLGIVKDKVGEVAQDLQSRATQDAQLIRDRVDGVAQGVHNKATQSSKAVAEVKNATQSRVNGAVQSVTGQVQGVKSSADKLAASTQQKMAGLKSQVEGRAQQDTQLIRDKVDGVAQGVHNKATQSSKAVAEVKNATQSRVNGAVQSVTDQVQGVKSSAEAMAHQFLTETVAPRIVAAVNHLEKKPGIIAKHPDGTRQFSSRDYDYQVAPDNQVKIVPHDDRHELTAGNIQPRDVEVMQAMTAKIDKQLKQAQQQAPEQKPSQRIKSPAIKA